MERGLTLEKDLMGGGGEMKKCKSDDLKKSMDTVNSQIKKYIFQFKGVHALNIYLDYKNIYFNLKAYML